MQRKWGIQRMNEAMYYIGTIFSVVFAVAAVGIFFYLKIPSVIRYLLENRGIRFSKIKQRKDGKKGQENRKSRKEKEKHTSEDTELLDVAQQYATALLDADCTELLSDMET